MPWTSTARWCSVLCLGLAIALASVPAQTPAPTPTPPTENTAELIEQLKKQIAGKENDPAESVFKNIQMLKGVPAGRVLAIMDFGFRASLGVQCAFCHDTKDFASDGKKEKKIAREMSKMAREINEKLKTIPGLDDDAAVNCTTCHRGQIKPALKLPTSGTPAR